MSINHRAVQVADATTVRRIQPVQIAEPSFLYQPRATKDGSTQLLLHART